MKSVGVYLHIPFCRSRCSYCDFATQSYDGALAERYLAALAGEINSFRADGKFTVETIYFGGGTPSLLKPVQVERLLAAIHARFRVTGDAEITLEMNPGTVTPEALRALRALGVNRASYGAQTFDDDELRRLGRTHTAADVRRTFADLRAAGYDNINFDLIAGLPSQTLAAWSRNLDEALQLRPAHLSLYLLDIHEGTPLAAQIKRGAQRPISDDLAAEMYDLMIERAVAAGYEHYEISNFALPNYESRHNTKYWTNDAAVYGFGCSAHSYDGLNTRRSNERDAARYTEMIETTGRAVVETIALDADDIRAESLYLGLRLMRGINLREHRARFGTDPRSIHGADFARLCEAGLIEYNDDILRLTRHGARLSNEVFEIFV